MLTSPRTTSASHVCACGPNWAFSPRARPDRRKTKTKTLPEHVPLPVYVCGIVRPSGTAWYPTCLSAGDRHFQLEVLRGAVLSTDGSHSRFVLFRVLVLSTRQPAGIRFELE